MKTLLAVVLAAGVASLGFSGCASQQYVDEQMGSSEGRIAAIEQRLDTVDSQLADLKQSDAEQAQQLDQLSVAAKEALARAEQAGQLAKGKFLYELRLSDNSVKFDFDQKELSAGAKAFLDMFATRLKSENENVFIEIQGHTDDVGPEKYNFALGKERAEQVLRYLHMTAEIPLHRMRAISYGEQEPIGDNSTPQGRAKNRTVVLMVME